MATPDNINADDRQSVYPPNSHRRTWAAIIITVVILAAGAFAFWYMAQ